MTLKPLYKNLVLAVIRALEGIFNQKEYANEAVYRILKSDKRWGARDRRFVAESIYDCVRWKRLYNEIAGIKNNYTPANLWQFVTVYLVLKGYTLPDWKEFENTPIRRIKDRFEGFQTHRAIRESIPDWLDVLGAEKLGEAQWEKELQALNRRAPVVIRVNTLKISRKELQQVFQKEGIATEILTSYPDALLLTNRANVFRTYAFRKGFFEMQDASSQLVAPYLQVASGMRVIDACAGAGGKTLHLAALMQNKGQLIALDIYQNKLDDLKKRAKRNGVFNVEARLITSNKTIKKLKNSADRLLIDAPCSGLGALKRNPDSKWKLHPIFIEKIKNTQTSILDRYSQMLRVNGLMVYATCSILPSENEEQMQNFLAMHPEFQLISEKKISPAWSGYDGFYMALLKKIT